MKATDMINKVKEVLGVELESQDQEIKLAQATLTNGTVIESEDFAVGSEVFIVTEDEKVALPSGTYSLEDGEELTVEEEGIIASIGTPEAETEEEEVEAAEEEEMKYATKEELAEIKDMVEEIKAMIKDKEEMSEEESEELSEQNAEEISETDEKAEEKEELSAQTPVEKVQHNPEAETETNKRLFSQNKRQTTADRVFERIANIKK